MMGSTLIAFAGSKLQPSRESHCQQFDTHVDFEARREDSASRNTVVEIGFNYESHISHPVVDS